MSKRNRRNKKLAVNTASNFFIDVGLEQAETVEGVGIFFTEEETETVQETVYVESAPEPKPAPKALDTDPIVLKESKMSIMSKIKSFFSTSKEEQQKKEARALASLDEVNHWCDRQQFENRVNPGRFTLPSQTVTPRRVFDPTHRN